jgi:hypothetical protein
MMLLQAGQLGLYRKNSIWTDELPPDMVAGCTLWLDGTDASSLWSAVNAAGIHPSADGDTIGSAHNKINPAQIFNYYNNFLELRSPADNGRSAIDFAHSGSGATGLVAVSPFAASAYLTTTNKLIVACVRVSGAAAHSSGAPWIDDAVFNDAAGYFGLHISDDSGQLYARAFNYSSGIEEVAQPFARNTFVVLTMSQQSGQLRVRVNGGSWASVASAATGSMTAAALVAYAAAGTSHGIELAHLAAVNTAQTDAAISAVERWIANDLGITPWW